MNVTVNGRPTLLPEGTHVGDLVDQLAQARRGTAVALDGEVVPRSRWDEVVLPDGAEVEVLTAAQGG